MQAVTPHNTESISTSQLSVETTSSGNCEVTKVALVIIGILAITLAAGFLANLLGAGITVSIIVAALAGEVATITYSFFACRRKPQIGPSAVNPLEIPPSGSPPTLTLRETDTSSLSSSPIEVVLPITPSSPPSPPIHSIQLSRISPQTSPILPSLLSPVSISSTVTAALVNPTISSTRTKPLPPGYVHPFARSPSSHKGPKIECFPKSPPIPLAPPIDFRPPKDRSIKPLKPVSYEEIIKAQGTIRPIPKPLQLIGYESPHRLRSVQMMLLADGTPGVNELGSDLDDREIVRQRIRMVHERIAPYAQTESSYEQLRMWNNRILLFGFDAWMGRPLEEIMESHFTNKQNFKERYDGWEPLAEVIGGGPIALTIAIDLFKYGYKVRCREQFSDDQEEESQEKAAVEGLGRRGFAERRQPFSLIRESYGVLRSVGVTSSQLFDAFGYTPKPDDPNDIEKPDTIPYEDFADIPEEHLHYLAERYGRGSFGNVQAWIRQLEGCLMLAEARKKRMGPHAEKYVPNAMSLPIYKTQRLLQGVIDKLQQFLPADRKNDFKLLFNKKCTGMAKDAAGRYVPQYNKEEQGEAPDILINATGASSQVNELLEFPQVDIATMYGMGVFFPPTKQQPVRLGPPLLTRAVRPFCSFHENEEFYVNVELFLSEVEDEAAKENIVNMLAHDMGFPTDTPRKHFTVKINLSHRKDPVRLIRPSSSDKRPPQIILSVGDAAISPHFITASGANFGLKHVGGLSLLFTDLTNGKIDHEKFCEEATKLVGLLQQRSPQMVLNLFGRPLPREKIPGP